MFFGGGSELQVRTMRTKCVYPNVCGLFASIFLLGGGECFVTGRELQLTNDAGHGPSDE